MKITSNQPTPSTSPAKTTTAACPPEDAPGDALVSAFAGCPFLMTQAMREKTVPQTSPAPEAVTATNQPGLSKAELKTRARAAARAAANAASQAMLPSPSLVALAVQLDLHFKTMGRGLDFWNKDWKDSSPERAIEHANTYQPVQMRVGEADWKTVAGLDELNQAVAEANRQHKKNMLARQGTELAANAAAGMSGCPFLAQSAKTETPEVGMLEFATRAIRFTDNPASFMREAHARYGPSFEVNLPTKGHLLFDTRSEVLRQALMNTDTGDDNWKKSPMQGHGASFLIGEKNMFLSGGEDWKFIQETLRPHLSGKLVHSDEMVGKLTAIFDKHLDNLKARVAASPNGELEINPRKEMQLAVLDVAFQVFLGIELPDKDLTRMGDAFSTQIEWLTRESLNPTDISLSALPGMGELREAYKTLNSVDEHIVRRQQQAERPKDMLTGLIEATDPSTGKPIDSERLRHEVLSLLEAGHETTATLMGWSLLLLARHPGEYAKLQKDIDEKLGQRKPTVKEVTGNQLAKNITDESLRLYPPFYLFMREAKEDISVGPPDNPITVPKGGTLVTNLYVTQRDEAVFGVESTGYPANEFHPARHDGDVPLMTPFGVGRRSCLGQALGRLENNLMLTRFVQAFDVAATETGPIQLGSDLSINSQDETIKIRLRKV